MKFVRLGVLGFVFMLSALGVYVCAHEPFDSAKSVDCYIDCIQMEVTTNVVGNRIVERLVPHIVLSFDVRENGQYDVYYGGVNGASLMRSGEMNEELWHQMKAMSCKCGSPFWCRERREIAVATNSVVYMSHSNLDVLRYAVTNTIPVGMNMPIDEVHPLIWTFLSPADTNQFWKKEEWMR